MMDRNSNSNRINTQEMYCFTQKKSPEKEMVPMIPPVAISLLVVSLKSSFFIFGSAPPR
jgi:hypothetical protein